MRRVRILVLPLLLLSPLARGSVGDDLGSPDPKVRSKAAEKIQEQGLYRPASRAYWVHRLPRLREGEKIDQAAAALKARGFSPPVAAPEFRGGRFWVLRLDEGSVLKVAFFKDAILQWRILDEPRVFSVDPPTGFNGYWTIYRVDGSAIHELYMDGTPRVPLAH